MVRAIKKCADTLSWLSALLAAVVMAGMLVLILVEIVARNLFDSSTYIAPEFVAYGLATFTFLGLGYTLAEGQLLHVSVLSDRISTTARRLLAFLSAILTLFLMAFLGWQFWSSMTVNFRNGTIGPSIAEVPLWIPEAILLLGIGVFLIQIMAQILMFLLSEEIEAETQQSSGV